MLDPLDTKRPALANHVFRLLTRGRTSAQRIPGTTFSKGIAAWSQQRSTAIVIVELRGGDIGRLLYQKGRLVYAGYGDLEPAVALQRISAGLGDSICTVVALSEDQASLAAASIDGRLTYSGAMPTRVDVMLQDLSERGFSGVICLESGSHISLWQLDVGVLISSPESHPALDRARMLQIVWVERDLPSLIAANDSPLNISGASQPQPNPSARIAATVAVSPQLTLSDPKIGQTLTVDALWTVFESVMRDQIGERTDRMLVLLRERHAHETADVLFQSLSKPLEHVAGVQSVELFRSLLT